MNSYNVVISDSGGAQHQFGISASTWQSAIDAAKTRVGISLGADTDVNILIVQWTGRLDISAT